MTLQFIFIAGVPFVAILAAYLYFYRNLRNSLSIAAGYLAMTITYSATYLLTNYQFNLNFEGIQETGVIFSSVIFIIATAILESAKKPQLSSKMIIQFFALIFVSSFSTALFLPSEMILIILSSFLASLIGTAVQFLMRSLRKE